MARVGRRRRHPRCGSAGARPTSRRRCDRRDLHLQPRRLRRRHPWQRQHPRVPADPGRHRQAARVRRAGTLKVTFDGGYRATVKNIDDSITDTLSSFSSRGVHGSIGVVKPDVAAPGDTIASAGMGPGTGPLVLSGTSMATPLQRDQRAGALPAPRLHTADDQGSRDERRGARRVDRSQHRARVRPGPGRRRTSRRTRVPSTAGDRLQPGGDNPVSASFGVVPAPVDQALTTKTLPLTVINKSRRTELQPLLRPRGQQPGVSYSVTPSTLTVTATPADRRR